MPELPEVEMYKRYADSTMLHSKITKIEVADKKLIKVSENTLEKYILGREFKSTKRIGKYLFVETTGDKLMVVHFGMTGSWKYFKDLEDTPKYSKVLFHFTNGFKMSYISKRKFGWIDLANSIEEFQKDHNLGKDALHLSENEFLESLENRKAPIKSILLNQDTMAGVGNWMADDILYQSQIHPETRANELTEPEKKKIYDKVQRVCKVAIENEAHYEDFPKDFLIHNRKKTGKCYHTGADIVKITVGGRGTFYSPEWQKEK